MSATPQPGDPGAEATEYTEYEEPEVARGGPAYQVVCALVTLALGIAGAALAWSYGLGTPQKPGAGLWPFAISVLIIGLSLLLVLTGRGLQDTEAFTRASLLPVVGLATFVIFGLLLPVIGFEIPALLLAATWMKVLGGESWRSTVIGSVAMVAAFYLLFLWGLKIPLPHLF